MRFIKEPQNGKVDMTSFCCCTASHSSSVVPFLAALTEEPFEEPLLGFCPWVESSRSAILKGELEGLMPCGNFPSSSAQKILRSSFQFLFNSLRNQKLPRCLIFPMNLVRLRQKTKFSSRVSLRKSSCSLKLNLGRAGEHLDFPMNLIRLPQKMWFGWISSFLMDLMG